MAGVVARGKGSGRGQKMERGRARGRASSIRCIRGRSTGRGRRGGKGQVWEEGQMEGQGDGRGRGRASVRCIRGRSTGRGKGGGKGQVWDVGAVGGAVELAAAVVVCMAVIAEVLQFLQFIICMFQIHNLLELVKKEQNIYNVAFNEIIRQVSFFKSIL